MTYALLKHICLYPVHQIENLPPVSFASRKFRNVTASRIPNAIAQLIGWLVNVQYSYSSKPIVLVVLEYRRVVMDSS